VHEAIHNWYYGVLGSNESKYPWMDEGFTTYAQDEVIDALYHLDQENPHAGSYADYIDMITTGEKEPLTTHADFYHRNSTYGTSAYSSGAVFLHQLSYVMGQEVFDAAMLRYFNEWKFRHPAPNDFIRVMEKSSGLELGWYLEQFIGSMNEVDYSVNAYGEGSGSAIVLERKGDFPMPLDVYVEYSDGTSELHYIPLDLMRGKKDEKFSVKTIVHSDWPWVYPSYSLALSRPAEDIKTVIIDPTGRLCDIHPENNVWPPKEGIIMEGK
jgi:aminopeptidase N